MAKRRSGETRASVTHDLSRAVIGLAQRSRRAASGSGCARSEGGFTLIELVVATAIMPLVFGAIAVGLIAVFSSQTTVSADLTDQTDAQVVSANFQTDVQSAAQITTFASSTGPAPCVPASSPQTQVFGLVLGNQSEITYAIAPVTNTNTYDLYRNVCTGGTLTESHAVARDLPSSAVPASQNFLDPVTITCTAGASACALTGGTPAYATGWQPTQGVTGVTFMVTAPGSNYKYTLTAVPAASVSSTQLAPVVTPSSTCGFALPTTGTYASSLCFVDFTNWNTQTGATGSGLTCAGGIPMSTNVANTPFILTFCISVSAVDNHNNQITGATSAGAACGVAARSGYNDITAVPLPTYSCPPGSEAFLGNNGFYTGVPGDPALYTVDEGSTATVKITQIHLQTAAGVPASNWQLVTGDAESTDNLESITWSSDQNLQLLNNSTNSPVGNDCSSAPPGYNATYLTGLGGKTVKCSVAPNDPGADHTGSVMLEAAAPNQLTVTLVGHGLQATFLGVLLS